MPERKRLVSRENATQMVSAIEYARRNKRNADAERILDRFKNIYRDDAADIYRSAKNTFSKSGNDLVYARARLERKLQPTIERFYGGLGEPAIPEVPEVLGSKELGAASVAAGQKIADWGSGIKSMLPESLGGITEEAARTEAEERKSRLSQLGDEYPVANFLGKMAPTAALDLAASAIIPGYAPLKYARGVAPAIAAGTAEGAMDPRSSAVAGGIAGGVGAGLGNAIMGPLMKRPSMQSETISALTEKQRGKGFWAPPGLRSGRRSQEMIDAALKANPQTAERVVAKEANNEALFKRQLAEGIGLKGTEIDVDKMGFRQQDIVNQLDDIYDSGLPKITPKDQAKLGSQIGEYERVMGKGSMPKIYKDYMQRLAVIKDHVDSGNSKLANKAFRLLKGDIGQRVSREYAAGPGGDTTLARMLSNMDDTLETAFGRSLPKDGKVTKQWKNLNDQYGLLKELYKDPGLVNSGKPNPDHILRLFRSGKGLNRGMMKKYRDIYDSARFIKNVKDSYAPTYGMSQRLSTLLDPKNRSGALTLLGTSPGVAGIPGLGNLTVGAYLGGWPAQTGLLNLPEALRPLLGQQGGGVAGIQFAPEIESLLNPQAQQQDR